MNVTQDLSFIALISNASLLVQLVMALLVLVSLMSWFYIFRKLFSIRSAKKQTSEFETAFWSGANLNALYGEVTASRRRSGGGALERIFEAGMEEYKKARVSFGGKNIDTGVLIDGARRAMRAAYQREMD
ncbi:MAG: MotA/TolQ/ExbB proton channel family protein, partial [Burkholderiaceae bacterium]